MSKQIISKKITAPSLVQRKLESRKVSNNSKALAEQAITVLTVYDYTTAKLMDQSEAIDCFLVGDSLGMVMLGYDSTVEVTMADMLHHIKAVRKGTKRSLLIADMPFGSVTTSEEKALDHIYQMMQVGKADCVKIEGATPHIISVIEQATTSGVPVMGHLGLTPQSVNQTGGYKLQNKTIAQVEKLIEESLALQKAGVFALVLEMVPSEVAELISQLLDIPTIGIGAGHYCDGQVLVIDDMLGKFTDLSPKFVRRYANLAETLQTAFTQFQQDVQSRNFPSANEQYFFAKEQLPNLNELAQRYGIELESTGRVARTAYANA